MERPFADLNPSERAAILGSYDDITLDELAQKYHYSSRHVARYLRLSKQITPLRNMLEEERLALRETRNVLNQLLEEEKAL